MNERTVLCEHALEDGTLIRAVHGDLLKEPVEAIVNAANEQLVHGGGLAGIIVRVGGREIQAESDAWIKAHGRVPTGTAAVTGAGRLPFRRIIHTVGPVWRDRGDEDDLLASAVNSALELAAKEGIRSLSLPAISTGIFGFPKARGARVITRAVLAAAPGKGFSEVNLTNIDRETAALFAAALEGLACRGEL
jgi:putative ATPase